MSWFQLDPESVVARIQSSSAVVAVPSMGASLRRGMIGFTLVSIAGFAPWAVGGRWIYHQIGEAGLYAICAFLFIGASGLFLHRLIIGPGSLVRFYKLFGLTFTAYAVAWIVGWMTVRGHLGSLAGLLAGTALMGWMLARAFDARGEAIRGIVLLFVLNSLGYFLGGWVNGTIAGLKEISVFGLMVAKPVQAASAKLLWGVSYGIGFGAGLGLAFHHFQAGTRALLATSSSGRS